MGKRKRKAFPESGMAWPHVNMEGYMMGLDARDACALGIVARALESSLQGGFRALLTAVFYFYVVLFRASVLDSNRPDLSSMFLKMETAETAKRRAQRCR